MIDKLESKLQEIEGSLERLSSVDTKKYDEYQREFECDVCYASNQVNVHFSYEEPALTFEELITEVDNIQGIINDLKSDIDLLKLAERRS